MPNDNQDEYPEKERYNDPPPTLPPTEYPFPPISNNLTNLPPSPEDIYAPSTGQKLVPGQYAGMQPNRRSDPPKKGNFWRTATLVMAILLVLCAGFAYLAYDHIINPPPTAVGSTATATSAPKQTPTSGTTPTITPTSLATSSSSPTTGNYSAIQPGPGCDKNGGTWTPKGSITNIACGTVTSDPTSTWGYLYLQLPSNRAFSANNEISIAGGNLATDLESGYNCLGLAEQDANMGFLGTYCGNGKWFIYSISNTGAIIQTLNQGITSTRTTEQISLTIQGAMLSLSIDTEIYKASILSIQPTQVAIAVSEPGDSSISIENFSYITPAS